MDQKLGSRKRRVRLHFQELHKHLGEGLQQQWSGGGVCAGRSILQHSVKKGVIHLLRASATPASGRRPLTFFPVERDTRKLGRCGVSYRIECLATGGSLGSGGDTLSSSASQPARHPSGHAVASVLLQHLPTEGYWSLRRCEPVLLSILRLTASSPQGLSVRGRPVLKRQTRAFVLRYHPNQRRHVPGEGPILGGYGSQVWAGKKPKGSSGGNWLLR